MTAAILLTAVIRRKKSTREWGCLERNPTCQISLATNANQNTFCLSGIGLRNFSRAEDVNEQSGSFHGGSKYPMFQDSDPNTIKGMVFGTIPEDSYVVFMVMTYFLIGDYTGVSR